MLEGKNILLGVTGGIAAYKACDIVSRLIKLNANIDVIMTKSAMEFVRPHTFQALSQNPVITDTFQSPRYWDIEHISLAQKADVFLIAPATANIIGKVANGIADDMLSTTIMASDAKIVFAP
ncbi:MAG: bifunctional 4'-phosphopantothenoylcysteine decarboxylase/phosphopantothenoylcysteine synthetase, partial [Clostridiales bacterium]|nr:bifunctional 4'-phosphopantothenoylcysteine decarboxylase/phosphopantothenoylcysteine synthetase [Clostridiales bacterium]